MADTERSISTLLTTLFQDSQAAGAITPQDVRDMIISLAPSFGGLYVSTAVSTVIAGVDTWTKSLGTTTLEGSVRLVSMPANNRLRNDGTATREFIINASISFTTASNSKTIGFGIAKNGTIDATTEIQIKSGTSDVMAAGLAASIELATTDYVELFIVNRTDGTDVSINFATMSMIGFLE